MIVRLGDQNLKQSDDEDGGKAVNYNIKRFIPHENYNIFTKRNDIALIELERNVRFDKDFIRPACLQQELGKDFNQNVTAVKFLKVKFTNSL